MGVGEAEVLRLPSESILAEYRLRSFSPWLASISLDVAMGGDVVQDPTQVIFIIQAERGFATSRLRGWYY